MSARLALAILSGFLFAFAFPNVAIGWLIFLAPIPLLLAIVRAPRAQEAVLYGWVSQTIAWLVMVPWVIRVMSHYGGLPYITGVLIYLAMCALLGLYGAAFAWIVYRIAPGAHFGKWLLVPVAWSAVEYARTFLLSGFPWNLVAASIVDYTPLIQIDRFAGPYALPMLIFLPATLISWLLSGAPRPSAARTVVIAAVIIICFVWWVTGYAASKMIARPPEHVSQAALLQPNISQEMRWDEGSLTQIFARMMDMTATAIDHGAKTVIWPESTVPLSYSRTDFYRDAIERISRDRAVDIILGSVAEDLEDSSKIWNAAFLVSNGKTIGHYDKMRLVPFGEYVPLRKMLFFAHKLVRAVGDFQFGTKPAPLQGAIRYGLAICYEIVFPQTRRVVVDGAEVLVTITNDAWYDGTSAPRQHLNQARLRAIETDRYLLRAATTGISALVDPAGRVLQELPMNRQGIIDARFEIRHTTTPYVRFGDWFAWAACIITAVATVAGRRK